MNIRDDAQLIIKEAIDRAMPDNAVKAALGSVSLPHKVKLVAIGKAGYQMARAAYDHLGSRIEKGVIITKYGHSAGSFSEDIAIYEAGHPVPDGNSVRGAEAALELARRFQKELLFRGASPDWRGRLGEIAVQVASSEREFIYVLLLDRRGDLLEEECLSFGGLEGAFLDMPYLFRRAVRVDAARVVLAHNHPDGSLVPSPEDRDLTVHVARRLPLLGMELEGHFVLAQGQYVAVPRQ